MRVLNSTSTLAPARFHRSRQSTNSIKYTPSTVFVCTSTILFGVDRFLAQLSRGLPSGTRRLFCADSFAICTLPARLHAVKFPCKVARSHAIDCHNSGIPCDAPGNCVCAQCCLTASASDLHCAMYVLVHYRLDSPSRARECLI
jgi:hypothetical protein